jgi:hypothetical protein
MLPPLAQVFFVVSLGIFSERYFIAPHDGGTLYKYNNNQIACNCPIKQKHETSSKDQFF